jgi:hypothetical protein
MIKGMLEEREVQSNATATQIGPAKKEVRIDSLFRKGISESIIFVRRKAMSMVDPEKQRKSALQLTPALGIWQAIR